MFIVTTLPERIFDATGNGIGRRDVPVVVLDGVTLNGAPIFEDEFDHRGRLTSVRG